MKGRESDLLTYLLHYCIFDSSKVDNAQVKNYKILKVQKYYDDRMDTFAQNMSTKLIGLTHMISI